MAIWKPTYISNGHLIASFAFYAGKVQSGRTQQFLKPWAKTSAAGQSKSSSQSATLSVYSQAIRYLLQTSNSGQARASCRLPAETRGPAFSNSSLSWLLARIGVTGTDHLQAATPMMGGLVRQAVLSMPHAKSLTIATHDWLELGPARWNNHNFPNNNPA